MSADDDDDRLIREVAADFNRRHTDCPEVVAGITLKHPQPRQVLLERVLSLPTLSDYPDYDPRQMPRRSAEYSPPPEEFETAEMTTVHKCKHCGRPIEFSFEYEVKHPEWLGFDPINLTDDSIAHNPMESDERDMSEMVEKIRALGYEANVHFYCENCIYDEFDEDFFEDYDPLMDLSIAVLSFTHLNEDKPHYCGIFLGDLDNLYEFLRGNNAMVDYDDRIWPLGDKAGRLMAMLGFA